LDYAQGKTSYLTPKCRIVAARDKGGSSVVATASIAKSELIAMWSGRIVAGPDLAALPEELRHRVVQIEEDLYLASLTPTEGADMVNHSCNPNAGLSGQLAIVAMRNIVPGEEVVIDYAMCDGSPYDEFDCTCGAPHCRRRITGNDWQRRDLWHRYAGYFSPYLQRRIERLKARVKD
jgi:uncharacterized protein